MCKRIQTVSVVSHTAQAWPDASLPARSPHLPLSFRRKLCGATTMLLKLIREHNNAQFVVEISRNLLGNNNATPIRGIGKGGTPSAACMSLLVQVSHAM